MHRTISITLLAVGVLLLFLGTREMDSVSSDISRFFTGESTDKAMWMLIAGVVGSSIGLVGLLSTLRKR